MNSLKESLGNYVDRKPMAEPIYKVAGIEKIAGIFVHQPTMDRITDKVKEYLLNEVAFFPKAYPVEVHIQPSEMQDTKSSKDFVKNGEGIATLDMRGNVLEFPFHIRDSEFQPFFVINHRKESVPFSRDNLKRIMYGIDKAQQEAVGQGPAGAAVVHGYKRVVDKVSPATAVGFANSGVQFRNEQKAKRGPQMMTLASDTALDNMMEKLASLEEITPEKISFLEEKIAEKIVAMEFKESMEKIASTEVTPSEYNKVNMINFIDLNSDSRVKHGDTVEIPVFDVSRGHYSSYKTLTGMFIHLKNVKGVLAPNAEFIPISGPTIGLRSNRASAIRKDVLTNLARHDAAIVGIGGEYKDIITKFEIEELKEGRSHFSQRLLDNKISKSYVNTVAGMNGVLVKSNQDLRTVQSALESFGDYQDRFMLIHVSGMKPRKYTFNTSGDHNADSARRTDLILRITEDIVKSGAMSLKDIQEDRLAGLNRMSYTNSNHIIIVGNLYDIKAIPLRYSPMKVFRSKKEIFDLFDATADLRIQKNASANETISLKKNTDSGSYDLSINYKDKNRKVFKNMNRSLYGLEPEKLKGVLTYLGYDDISADSIANRADRSFKSSHTLPANNRASEVNVGDVESRAKQRAKKIVGKAIEVGVPTSLALGGAYVLSRNLAESNPGAFHRNKIINALNFVNGKFPYKTASELNADISAQFEKIAGDYSSPSALRVAKALNIGARYFEKIAAVEAGKIYSLQEISRDIVNVRDVFNKTACQLLELNDMQLMKGENQIDGVMIKEAIDQIDLLLKTATLWAGGSSDEKILA